MTSVVSHHPLQEVDVRHPNLDVAGESVLQDLVHLVDPPDNGVVDLALLLATTEFLK